MSTNPRSHLKPWTRRALGTALATTLALVTLAGVVLAGVIAGSRPIHQPVPTGSTGTRPASLQHTEPGNPAPTAERHGRRLAVAFVAGTHGTIASDLLAPYDIFSSSPALTTYVVADAATQCPSKAAQRWSRRTRSPTSTQIPP